MDQRWSREDLSHFEEQLRALHAEIFGEVDQLGRETLEHDAAPRPDPDDPSALSPSLDVLAAEERLGYEVRDALVRLREGGFGHCESCGRHIARRRLAALPWARECIACARRSEAEPSA